MIGESQANFEQLLCSAFVSGNILAIQAIAKINSALQILNDRYQLAELIRHVDDVVYESDYITGIANCVAELMDAYASEDAETEFVPTLNADDYKTVRGLRGEPLLTEAHWEALESAIANSDNYAELRVVYNRLLRLFYAMHNNYSNVYWRLQAAAGDEYTFAFLTVMQDMAEVMNTDDQLPATYENPSEVFYYESAVADVGFSLPIPEIIFVPPAERYVPPKYETYPIDEEPEFTAVNIGTSVGDDTTRNSVLTEGWVEVEDAISRQLNSPQPPDEPPGGLDNEMTP